MTANPAISTTYKAQSLKGRTVMTFDSEDKARAFAASRAGLVRMRLVKETTTQEVLS